MTTWPAGRGIVRVYDARHGPRAFFAGTDQRRGRFNPFTAIGGGDPVKVLHGSDQLAGAISETVFDDVPVRGTKHVPLAKLRLKMAATLTAARDLVLADLTGLGLRRIQTHRAELLDSDPRSYPFTVEWARAVHAHPTRFDGITWVSHQYDIARAQVLFGDRVSEGELTVAADITPMTLAFGRGLDAVLELADRADITIT